MNNIWNIRAELPNQHYAVTPSDTVNLPRPMWIYSNTTGNIVIVDEYDVAVTYVAAVGWKSPIMAKRVNATSTTATTIVGLY